MAAAAWLVVATLVAVILGRMIRARDRQVPLPEDAPSRPAGRPQPGVAGWGGRYRRT